MIHCTYPDPYRVDFDGDFSISEAPTAPPDDTDSNNKLKKQLRKANDTLYDLQRLLYAHNRYAILLVFQAMDAAGKDSTIRTVLRGVNPAGCQVFSFKQPSAEELEHDFLWRSTRRLPERGRIGIFNRSYYEEVLVVRVHPGYLASQNLVGASANEAFWEHRLQSIRDHELHLARSGTVVIKFWLNVSKEQQKNRFLDRLDSPHKNWKFSSGDVAERGHWDDYMAAYESMLKATSRGHAPWYAIPADNKRFMRVQVANTIIDTLRSLDMAYPKPDPDEAQRFDEYRAKLNGES